MLLCGTGKNESRTNNDVEFYRNQAEHRVLPWALGGLNSGDQLNQLALSKLESTIQKVLGKTGLMSFVQFDHGAVLRKGTNRETPRMVRVVMGNPLIMKEMAKHVPDAGSYAPVTVLVGERSEGVHLSYDRMSS